MDDHIIYNIFPGYVNFKSDRHTDIYDCKGIASAFAPFVSKNKAPELFLTCVFQLEKRRTWGELHNLYKKNYDKNLDFFFKKKPCEGSGAELFVCKKLHEELKIASR